MDDIMYVGLDVHKPALAKAGGDGLRGGRRGRARWGGAADWDFEHRPDILCKLAARLGKGGARLSFCYEAGPCGYGLSVC